MSATDAQRQAVERYRKAHLRSYVFRCNIERDADIIAALAEQDNKQGYVKRLIREDVARRHGGEETRDE